MPPIEPELSDLFRQQTGHVRKRNRGPTTTAASNTAAIGSDLWIRGQATGCIRKTFLWSRLTACITCATRCIRALTLHSASQNSGSSGVIRSATSFAIIGAGSTVLARAGFLRAPASSSRENRCQPQIFPNGMDMGDLHPLAVDVATAVLAPHVQRV